MVPEVQGSWHKGWCTAPDEGRKYLYKLHPGLITIWNLGSKINKHKVWNKNDEFKRREMSGSLFFT